MASREARRPQIKKLLEEYVPGKTLKTHLKLVLGLFNSVRHNYLHDGTLMGCEYDRGFLFNQKEMVRLVENMANIEVLTRSLIEQYLQKKAVGITRTNTDERPIILNTKK